MSNVLTWPQRRPRIIEPVDYRELLDASIVGTAAVPLRVLAGIVPYRALLIFIHLLAEPDHTYTETIDRYGKVDTFESHFGRQVGFGTRKGEIARDWLVSSDLVLERRIDRQRCEYHVNPDVLRESGVFEEDRLADAA